MIALKDKLMSRTARSESGCIEWTGAQNAAGYGVTWRKPKTILAHRLAWILEYGEISAGLHVCHRCDNPACVNVAHLFLGTPADNCADKIAKGRLRYGVTSRPGEKNPLSKLRTEQVLEIRASSETQRLIASRFGISQGIVSDIKCRKRWRHV